MKTHIYATILALIIPMAATAAEPASVHPVDARLAACMDKAVTTLDMNECNSQALQAWDAQLNLNYRKLLHGQPAAVRAALIQSQRDWVVYRDSYFKGMRAFYGQEQGTIWGLIAGGRQIDVVREKALDLQALADSVKLD